jgi:hypothetical protein
MGAALNRARVSSTATQSVGQTAEPWVYGRCVFHCYAVRRTDGGAVDEGGGLFSGLGFAQRWDFTDQNRGEVSGRFGGVSGRIEVR